MSNPFVIDRPLSQDDLYYGREDAFASLRRGLIEGQRLFCVQGAAGAGKTSFLNQLDLRISRYAVSVVSWISLGGGLAQSPERDAERLIEALPDADDRPRLLCVDDIPWDWAPDGAAWTGLATAILALLDHLDSALLLSIESPPGCDADVPGAKALPLGLLPESEVQDLLMIPSRRRLAWGLDIMQRIYRLSGGDPLLCQAYGHIIFERRAGRGWVSMPDIDDATRVVVERFHARFRDLWEACSPSAQLVLCCLAEMPGRRDLARAEDISTYLRQQRIEIDDDQIRDGLRELLDVAAIERLGGETYRLTHEALRPWITGRHTVLSIVASRREFRRHHVQSASFLRSERFDWVSLALWGVAAALLFTIGYVWRSRETTIFWTSTPTPRAVASESSATPRILQTPQKGTAPGHIAYQAKESTDHHWSIYSMRSDGSDPVRLTDSGGNDTSPVWSPDGRQIAFVSDRGGNREIYVMNADGNDQRNLTVHGAEDWTPTWSPDGKELAFASFRDGNWDIYVLSLEGGEPIRLTDDPSSEYSPAWSPDGDLLAFASNRDGDLNIFVMSLEDGEVWRVTEDDATDQTPAWRPDGGQLVWESYRENNMELFVAGVDGSNMAPLSRDAYADDHGACWSPWGEAVAYYSNRDEGWDIYTYNVATGERLNLTMSPMLEQAPNWGP